MSQNSVTGKVVHDLNVLISTCVLTYSAARLASTKRSYIFKHTCISKYELLADTTSTRVNYYSNLKNSNH